MYKNKSHNINRILLMTLIIVMLLCSLTYSQSDSIYMIKTFPFDVNFYRQKQLFNPKTRISDTIIQQMAVLESEQVNYLKGSELIIKKDSIQHNLNVNNMQSIKFYKGGNFWKGVLYGSITGFVLGAIGGFFTVDQNNIGVRSAWALAGGITLAIPGALLGGMIGGGVTSEHDYDISKYSSEQKTARLIRLFRQYKKF